MKKKKLKLDELTVQSFVTSETKEVKGGSFPAQGCMQTILCIFTADRNVCTALYTEVAGGCITGHGGCTGAFACSGPPCAVPVVSQLESCTA